MKKRNLKDNQEGFTLIEIIAVLVLLGILAAVALPKYFSLADDAKNKAANAAVSEGGARLNQWGANYLLSQGYWPANATAYVAASVSLGTDGGDFIISYTASGGAIVRVIGTGRSGTSVSGGAASKSYTVNTQ